MKPRCFLVSLAAMLAATTATALAGELYRWVDQSGKVHYSDVPAAEAVQPVQKKFADSPLANADLPYETRRAREAFPVTLYVADNCKELCQRARDLLNKRGIPFTEKTLVTREDAAAFRKLSGVDSVPVLVVGSNWLKGFLAEQWNSELDIAGYPKAAPYGFRPAPSPPAARKPDAQPAPESAPEPEIRPGDTGPDQ